VSQKTSLTVLASTRANIIQGSQFLEKKCFFFWHSV